MSEQTFWAWLAGFMDGDGYFQLTKHKTPHAKNGYQWVPLIAITQKQISVLEFIKNQLGFGYISKCKRKAPRLMITQRKARWLLPKVLPHLRVKREKARLLYEACKIIGKGKKWSYVGRPDWEDQKLAELAKAIQETPNVIVENS